VNKPIETDKNKPQLASPESHVMKLVAYKASTLAGTLCDAVTIGFTMMAGI
jgi:hypothetical protein